MCWIGIKLRGIYSNSQSLVGVNKKGDATEGQVGVSINVYDVPRVEIIYLVHCHTLQTNGLGRTLFL